MYMINPTLNIKLYQNYELEELLDNRLYELNDEAILRLLSALESRFTYEEAVNSITSIFDCEKEMSEDIFKTILERNIFIERSKDDALYKNKLEWIERNWSPSLLHYVTSRNIEFQDTGSDEDKEIASNHYKKLIREKKAPDLYKNYINSSFISLPKSEFKTTKDFYKVLMNRKTHREFGEVSLDINEFSEILYMATQDARVIRKKVSENIVQNPNLYTNSVFTCNEIYLYINNVSNIPPGIYHYDMKSHGLNHLNNLPDKSAGYYCYGQPEIENANCIIFISANYHKYMWRYNHERAYRNLLIDVAQLAQSFLLAATNLQKKTFLTPALRDSELVKLFDLEEYIEDIRYLVAIGN